MLVFRSLLAFSLTTLFATSAFAFEDHAEHMEGPFERPQDVTEACVECHEEQTEDFMKSNHWLWKKKQNVPGKGEIEIGKHNLINNFCSATPSNNSLCSTCHAGYGMEKDDPAYASKSENVDCLVCHDTSGTYEKEAWTFGMVDKKVDLTKVAQSVGGEVPKDNCGSCHFYGGGGDGVKHGDLDSSLLTAKRSLDVHMAKDGADMSCQECHKVDKHHISGMGMSTSTGDGKRVACTDCHAEDLHERKLLNRHAKVLACESCHIPTYAREKPTKMSWDWSQAGEDRDVPKNKWGLTDYLKKKGSFVWEQNAIPEYAWYNGTNGRLLLADKIDPTQTVVMNPPIGEIKDSGSKIYPYKIMRGKQPYDTVNNIMLVPNVVGYWEHFNWQRAFKEGMASAA
ncbi:tetrathionate reductase family octaheme c-type cytochrome, partial [Myxococcota bacterium]|nr:tetrathionate reductase family octaheme c-type cytochrome [Myxococcota bacterium]